MSPGASARPATRLADRNVDRPQSEVDRWSITAVLTPGVGSSRDGRPVDAAHDALAESSVDTPHDTPHGTRLDITVRRATGTGSTPLSAFDHALGLAGVADFNLIPLSSVIPPQATVRRESVRLDGGHGDRLYCVLATAHASAPGDIAWAGLGWSRDSSGRGLFVEHRAGSEESLREQIGLSLDDLSRHRGGGFDDVDAEVAAAHYHDQPTCALVIAAYAVRSWDR